MQPDGKPQQDNQVPGAQVASLLGLLLAVLFGVIAPLGLWAWQAHAPSVALRSEDVGTFVSADSTQGGFASPTLTNVHATGGSIAVLGTFSALKRQPLSVQDLNKSGLHLCVTDVPASCVPLAGAWAGALAPTSHALKVFDFYRYGLTREHFGGWLMIGCVLSFVTLLAVGATVPDAPSGGNDGLENGT